MQIAIKMRPEKWPMVSELYSGIERNLDSFGLHTTRKKGPKLLRSNMGLVKRKCLTSAAETSKLEHYKPKRCPTYPTDADQPKILRSAAMSASSRRAESVQTPYLSTHKTSVCTLFTDEPNSKE